MASAANAQAPPPGQSQWTVGASAGAYFPSSALIKADDSNTELAAGPAFSIEGQYQVSNPVAVYLNGTLAFGTVQLGSSLQPAVVGPSTQATLTIGTAGVMLTATNWFGEHLQPTLRLGGGLKWYGFDLTDAENQIRPAAEVGLGLRSVGNGRVQGMAEVRYLLSSFDQGKLPTRGIAPQDQRQNDFVFSIGIGLRP